MKMKVYIMMVSYSGREDSIVEVFADYDACATAVDFANSGLPEDSQTEYYHLEFKVS